MCVKDHERVRNIEYACFYDMLNARKATEQTLSWQAQQKNTPIIVSLWWCKLQNAFITKDVIGGAHMLCSAYEDFNTK